MSIELVPLCTVSVQVRPPIEVGTGPSGTRMIFESVSAKMQGRRLNASQVGAAAGDWLTVGPQGTASLDIRSTYRTDDDAIVFVHMYGRADVSAGMVFPVTIYVAPRFETGDERYGWLNHVQAIGKGVVNEDLTLEYEWYEVR